MTSDRTTGGRSDQAGSRSRRHRRARGERGAALVEFAIVAPLLFLLIFGIIEFGWAFFQNLDARHGARETSRLAAVNYGTGSGDAQRDALVLEACSRMDGLEGVDIEITKSGSDVGDDITVIVRARLNTLTGALDNFLDGIVLDSTVQTRAEMPLTWSNEPSEALPGNDCP